MRMYQCFKTKKEQTAWEKERKQDPAFQICMRYTAEQLDEALCLPKGTHKEFKYATIYTTDY